MNKLTCYFCKNPPISEVHVGFRYDGKNRMEVKLYSLCKKHNKISYDDLIKDHMEAITKAFTDLGLSPGDPENMYLVNKAAR